MPKSRGSAEKRRLELDDMELDISGLLIYFGLVSVFLGYML